MKISIIIPVLDDVTLLAKQLARLQQWRSQGHEVIVVDGGGEDTDAAAAVAKTLADRFLASPPGRAIQMNLGADQARGEILLFLHVDTILPTDAWLLVQDALHGGVADWGRFDVRLSGRFWMFRIIERCMNLRSAVTRIATGDQAIFVRRRCFDKAGGFPAIALMEDIAISKRLRRISRPARIRQVAVTSSRRWEQHGILRTVLLMWWLRFSYFCGASPQYLAGKYYGTTPGPGER